LSFLRIRRSFRSLRAHTKCCWLVGPPENGQDFAGAGRSIAVMQRPFSSRFPVRTLSEIFVGVALAAFAIFSNR